MAKRVRPDRCYACGSPAVRVVKDVQSYNNSGMKEYDSPDHVEYYVACSHCDSGGPGAFTKKEAIEKWNEETIHGN